VSPRAGAFLGLRIRHAGGSPAIGAAAAVTLPDGRTLRAQVDGGSGHSGKRSPEVHFGLGAVNQPVKVEIRWRDAGGVNARTETLAPGWHTITLEARQ